MSTALAAAPKKIVCKDRAEWLVARRGFMQASEAAVVLGIAPDFIGSPMALYAEKLGLAPERQESERMRLGRRFQRPIADEYCEITGRQIEDLGDYTITVSPRNEWMGATIDYRLKDPKRGPGVLEVKYQTFGGGEWDEGEPPAYQQAQLQHGIECADVEWGSLVVFIGGRIKYADFDKNARFISLLIEREAEFLDLVRRQVPPAVDGRESTARALTTLYAKDNGSVIALPDDAVRVDEEIQQLTAQAKGIEEQLEVRKNWIRAALGENTDGLLPDGALWRWRQQVAHHEAKPARDVVSRPLRRLGGKRGGA